MAWLVHDGVVLASLDRAESIRERTQGLLGRDSYEGALLLAKTRSVHTIGMRFPIDVAFCSRDLTILNIVTVPQRRVTRPHWKAYYAIETEAGRFSHWKVQVGDQLELRGIEEFDG